MPTNRDIIRMHLEDIIDTYPNQTWYSLMGYCIGYYDKIDMDIIWVIHCLQLEGKIQ